MPTKERVADMTVTTTQLAAVLGITNRRVQQLTQDGVLTTVSRGKFVLGDAVQAYNASTARGGLTKEEAAEGLAPTEESSSTSDGKVNINTASVEELTSLKGIGQTRAESIVAYRQEHGAFAAVEDLKAVSGIGDATYQKIADAITVN